MRIFESLSTSTKRVECPTGNKAAYRKNPSSDKLMTSEISPLRKNQLSLLLYWAEKSDKTFKVSNSGSVVIEKNWISSEEENRSWSIDILSDIIGQAPSHCVNIKLIIDILSFNCFSVIIDQSKFVKENAGTCTMIPMLLILDFAALSIT